MLFRVHPLAGVLWSGLVFGAPVLLGTTSMQYTISKTIKKTLKPQEVFTSICEKLRVTCSIPADSTFLTVTGFNRNLGGINYVATARFTMKPKEGRTVITADIQQKPTVIFFVLLALTLLSCFGVVFPIFFYFYGKNQVTKTIERTLDEVAEELQ